MQNDSTEEIESASKLREKVNRFSKLNAQKKYKRFSGAAMIKAILNDFIDFLAIEDVREYKTVKIIEKKVSPKPKNPPKAKVKKLEEEIKKLKRG